MLGAADGQLVGEDEGLVVGLAVVGMCVGVLVADKSINDPAAASIPNVSALVCSSEPLFPFTKRRTSVVVASTKRSTAKPRQVTTTLWMAVVVFVTSLSFPC